MSLGALIAKSRTDARLSIEELAKATNIPPTLLRDMENNSFVKCGGETYARGHLRNMAAKLSVDERTFLDLFEVEFTAPAKPIRELLNKNNVTMPYQEPKRISWKILAVGSAAALIMEAMRR
jgi:cytoskeletal protein RodZ